MDRHDGPGRRCAGRAIGQRYSYLDIHLDVDDPASRGPAVLAGCRASVRGPVDLLDEVQRLAELVVQRRP
ncbi:MAG TPA: hypothetical protein VLJ59_19870 [Mycobacteriales bacterium]|nr:hypothetical protein [Mycobacteriales bacterium]